MSFLYSINATIIHINKVKIVTMKKGTGFFENPDVNGKGIFIPKIPEIIVGIDIKIVTEARTFITIFRLLEITEAKKSIVLAKILL